MPISPVAAARIATQNETYETRRLITAIKQQDSGAPEQARAFLQAVRLLTRDTSRVSSSPKLSRKEAQNFAASLKELQGLVAQNPSTDVLFIRTILNEVEERLEEGKIQRDTAIAKVKEAKTLMANLGVTRKELTGLVDALYEQAFHAPQRVDPKFQGYYLTDFAQIARKMTRQLHAQRNTQPQFA